jgi:hypothetical protein
MRFILGFILGSILISGISYGYRIPKPLRITDFDQKGLVTLNDNLEKLWDLTNGRFNLDIVTSNPDGSLTGDVGDMLLFNNSGTYYLEICVGGTVWLGEQLSDTP